MAWCSAGVLGLSVLLGRRARPLREELLGAARPACSASPRAACSASPWCSAGVLGLSTRRMRTSPRGDGVLRQGYGQIVLLFRLGYLRLRAAGVRPRRRLRAAGLCSASSWRSPSSCSASSWRSPSSCPASPLGRRRAQPLRGARPLRARPLRGARPSSFFLGKGS